MSIIETIRNKYLGLMVGAIVVALLAFLVMSGLESGTGIFGEDRSSIATINGTKVSAQEYRDLEQKMISRARAENKRISDAELNQVSEEAWDELLKEKLLNQEFEKLGIDVSKKELRDMLTSDKFADPAIRQNFTDPNTGIFDGSKVKEYVNNLPKMDSNTRKQFAEFEKGLKQNRIGAKYTAMLGMGYYVPQALINKIVEGRNAVASIDYVKIPYSSIADDKVKVEDKDVTEVMKKYKSMYTLDQELRSGSYVSFDIIPSSVDTANSLGKILSLRSQLETSTDLATFISSNSDVIYDKEYYAAGRAETPKLDSAHKAPVGAIVGPYYEDGMFKLTKITDRKSIPDSVRTSHILVAITKDFGEEAAKKRIDSFEAAIKAGASFEQIASTSSDDGGSKTKGGDLGYQPKGVMVSEYNDFMFSGKKGEMKKVKTRFGWHLIKIVDQKDFQSSTQSVTLAKKLIAGDETKNKQYTAATNFLKAAKDKKSFEEQAKKLGLNIRTIEAASKTQNAVAGLEKARELIRFLFENKTGKVSPIINSESSYVVGLVGDIMPKGLAPVKLVKDRMSGDIVNNKKTKMIGDMYKGMDLAAIASKAGVQVMSADTVRQEGESSLSINQDKRVCGAAFNKNAKTSVVGPIQGYDGVYFIKTKNVTPAPQSSADPITVGQERNMQMTQMMQNLGRALPFLLQKRADVKDNRALFF